jgi:hypothetical protein
MTKMFVAGLLIAVTFVADRPPPAPPSGDTPWVSVYGYGDVDATCQQWLDGCRACSRSNDGSAPACSNIGFSCQPKAIECTSRSREPGK